MKISICYWNRNRNILRIKYKCISSWSANNPLIRRNKLLIITLLPFFTEMLQYEWLWSGHMIIKEMFYIPIELKPELARASMTTSDVNNQWRSNFQQQIILSLFLLLFCLVHVKLFFTCNNTFVWYIEWIFC
jgi:hypothetical protein